MSRIAGSSLVKNLPAVWEIHVQSLGQEDPLPKGLATHSSILAWRIPWIEEAGYSPRGHKVGHDWEWLTHFHSNPYLTSEELLNDFPKWLHHFLHSRQQCTGVLISSHPCQYLLLSDFLTLACLVDLTVVSICLSQMTNGVGHWCCLTPMVLFPRWPIFRVLFSHLQIFSLEKCLLNSFACFWTGCFGSVFSFIFILLFFWLWCMACGMLASGAGIEPALPELGSSEP